MSPQELLSSQRTVYVLAEKPGIDDTTAKPYWSLKLEGLHPDQLKSAVARLRTQGGAAIRSFYGAVRHMEQEQGTRDRYQMPWLLMLGNEADGAQLCAQWRLQPTDKAAWFGEVSLAGEIRPVAHAPLRLREAARLTASGMSRIGQELALSSLFVAVFIYWLNDSSPAQQHSLALLQRKLQCTDKLKLWR